jgi:hypothetical protein
MLAFACEVPTIEFPNTVDLLVVEGWISSEQGPYTISLSRTNSFETNQIPEGVSDARVVVQDNSGNTFEYRHLEDGIYSSDSSAQGIIGNSYRVLIYLESGDTISSNFQTLLDVHEIEILTYDFFLGETEENPGVETEIYYPVIFATDPPGQRNYYRWNIYRNDSLFASPGDLVLYEDRFISGFYKNEFTGFEFLDGDTITAEVQSLTLEAYQYLLQFKTQTTSVGTSSGISPSSIEGNLINLSNPNQTVLGFFSATAVRRRQATIVP